MSDIEDYSIMSDNDGSDSEMEFKQNKIVKNKSFLTTINK